MASEDPIVNASNGDDLEPEPPRTNAELEQITRGACDTTLSAATSYTHSETESWNTSIINSILQGLMPTEAEERESSNRPSYKFAVNSTIIQHLSDPVTTTSSSTGTITEPSEDDSVSESNGGAKPNGSLHGLDGASSAPAKGRRGMHSATGAFWNNDTDGMWSYKWEGGDKKGMDVVVSIIWVLSSGATVN